MTAAPLWIALSQVVRARLRDHGADAVLLDDLQADALNGRSIIIAPSAAKREDASWAARRLRTMGAANVAILEPAHIRGEPDIAEYLDAADAENRAADLDMVAQNTLHGDGATRETGTSDQPDAQLDTNISINEFRAYMPEHNYIFEQTGEHWPAVSVNARLPRLKISGMKRAVRPSDWLDRFQAVEQKTWAPGEPRIITDRLIDQGGWINRSGCRVFNLYRPPVALLGDPKQAGLWRMHLEKIYPNEHKHIERWLAHRVQHPGEKVNHGLVLQGGQGIGKDTILEPVKHGVGAWNWSEISPMQMMGRFNPWARAVVVRISEARDLGDTDRYGFYDHCKVYIAAPPDVLRIDAKFMHEHYVPNLCGVIITTNHDGDGIYLEPDDRRHFVASSESSKEDFDEQYWTDFWDWYAAGGIGHVVAYLRNLDLSEFNPKAPPPKTAGFWRIVHTNAAPEDAGFADVLEALERPPVLTLQELSDKARDRSLHETADCLSDPKRRRIVPHRMKSAGYVILHNQDAKDGLWKIRGRRQAVYALREIPYRLAVEAMRNRMGGQ